MTLFRAVSLSFAGDGCGVGKVNDDVESVDLRDDDNWAPSRERDVWRGGSGCCWIDGKGCCDCDDDIFGGNEGRGCCWIGGSGCCPEGFGGAAS